MTTPNKETEVSAEVETARQAIYRAAINCRHEIDTDTITLHRNSHLPGNALSQMADRLDAAALLANAAGGGDLFWLYELEKGQGIYQGGRGVGAEAIVRQVADGFPEAGEPFCILGAHPPAPVRAEGVEPVDALRALGLTVAVHNDYRLKGESHTFWLMTDASGMSYKGEGRTDAEALAKISEQVGATPAQASVPLGGGEVAVPRKLAYRTWAFLAQDCSPCAMPDCQIDGKNVGVNGLVAAWAAITAHPLQPQDGKDAVDARRYRWLRAQHWNDNTLCVVARPKEVVRLGATCPSGGLLDDAIAIRADLASQAGVRGA